MAYQNEVLFPVLRDCPPFFSSPSVFSLPTRILKTSPTYQNKNSSGKMNADEVAVTDVAVTSLIYRWDIFRCYHQEMSKNIDKIHSSP